MRLSELTEDIDQSGLNQVEAFADRLWAKLGIDVAFTNHFIQRVNDERNGKPISTAELIRLFKKEYESYGPTIKKLDDRSEAVLKDLTTQVNLPFVIKDTDDGKTIVAKTVMRNPNFRTPDPEFTIK
ncbi:MAG TPA: hypothetical protein VIY47_15515 [Ignavibacteriaceae bacterium]